MREDETRRTLKWLTEIIGRLLARDRMEWAQKLQRKSLTSGAIDSDVAPGALAKKRAVKVIKVRVQEKGKDKRDSSRDSLDAPKASGICLM